jgi:hypothetical protein
LYEDTSELESLWWGRVSLSLSHATASTELARWKKYRLLIRLSSVLWVKKVMVKLLGNLLWFAVLQTIILSLLHKNHPTVYVRTHFLSHYPSIPLHSQLLITQEQLQTKYQEGTKSLSGDGATFPAYYTELPKTLCPLVPVSLISVPVSFF